MRSPQARPEQLQLHSPGAAGRDERRAEYEAYIRSKAWRTKRQLVLLRDGKRCVRCGSAKRLHVHHRTYARFGREALSDLETLCERCHEREHGHPRRRGRRRTRNTRRAEARRGERMQAELDAEFAARLAREA